MAGDGIAAGRFNFVQPRCLNDPVFLNRPKIIVTAAAAATATAVTTAVAATIIPAATARAIVAAISSPVPGSVVPPPLSSRSGAGPG